MNTTEATTIIGHLAAAPEVHTLNGKLLASLRVTPDEGTSPGPRFLIAFARGRIAEPAQDLNQNDRVEVTGHLVYTSIKGRPRRKLLRVEAEEITRI